MTLPSIRTDLVDVTNELEDAPCRVLFKKESQQPSGSFKLRGIGYLVAKSIEETNGKDVNVEVFSSSGGNAGLAAAYSANFYGVECTVVLPKTAKATVVADLEKLGARVIVNGSHWGEADTYLKELIKGLDKSVYPVYCHPFDDPLVWEGHGAIVSEIESQLSVEECSKVKGVICSVGGGGLLCGVVGGLKNTNHLRNVPVVAVESTGAPCFDEAIKHNKVTVLDTVKTYATSLAAPYVCEKALEYYHTHPIHNHVIPDIDTVTGTLFYYDTFGEIVEPACGASISLVSRNIDKLRLNLQPDDILIVIVCGGTVTKEPDLDEYRHLK